MIPLLYRSSARYLLRHPWQIGLALLGVALGVAVVVSIDIAGTSARRAFALSAEAVTGRATHQIVGSAPFFSDSVYRELRVRHGIRTIAPVIEGDVQATDYAGRTFHLLGVDPLAEAAFRSFISDAEGSGSIDGKTLLTQPRSVVLSAAVARELGLMPGDTLAVDVAGKRESLIVGALLASQDEKMARALDNLLLMDIAGVQEVLGKPGLISRIDVILPDPPGDAQQTIQHVLPPGMELLRSSTRTESIASMTQAFTLNLAALSLLALVVGVFLIYNTMTFSVVQRRPFIGRLRAVGVTRAEVFRLVLGEALLIGIVGTVAGTALGIVLGRVLLGLITQTINDLYYVVSVRDIAVDPFVLLKGIVLGVVSTVLAAVQPAREATRSSPRSVFSRSTLEVSLRKKAPALALWGLGLMLVGATILIIINHSVLFSHIGLLFVLLGCALTVPQIVIVCMAILRPVAARLFGMIGRMATRGIVSTLSRTSVAIAALMIAISATIGVGVMVDTFRKTVATWLEMTLEADVYISVPGPAASTVKPEVVRQLAATPGAYAVHTIRFQRAFYNNRPFDLAVLGGEGESDRFSFLDGLPQKWEQFRTGNVVFVSEPFAYHFGKKTGDTLALRTDRGVQKFLIAGEYYDYASDMGAVLIGAPAFARYWSDTTVTGLSLSAREGVPVDTLIARLRAVAANQQPLIIRSNKVLREASLAIFDRTFAVTDVLRLLTIIVAFVGVLSALMALQLERAREIAVLRATGLTPAQVWKLVTLQTGLMGLTAGLLALPVGLILSVVLIYVVNKRSFGWTLQFEVAPDILIGAVVLAVIAALIAGVYPAFKMARTSPAEALRSE